MKATFSQPGPLKDDYLPLKFSRTQAAGYLIWCALDDDYSDRVVAYNRATERMLLVPAPDLPALAAKIALAIDEQAWELPRGEACMARLVRDSRRLCG